ncbi:uncharacterized protein LOC115716898 isoform X4 [Cannabis sativa]|uniref:uncharacterized protein LOC115716898 isoform X4 n=1 Tax=Cannabis sativa TaxID=3483 RepID=UPI0029CA7560|nr:uncharacterized protein LOC115716898 isoform X4 [Cannabis sativa]
MRYVKPLSLFQDLLKTNGLERGRLLGLDVGSKYIGLAVSDINNKIASPLRKKSNIELMADDLKCLSVLVKLFIDELCNTNKLTGIKYTYWDEHLTSKTVEMLLKPLNLHPVHSKIFVDKFAAVNILQEYLDYVNRSTRNES